MTDYQFQTLAAVFAAFRLSEIITLDYIALPLRNWLKQREAKSAHWWWHWPHYFMTCPRCVSVSTGLVCYLWFPVTLNIALAISWLAIAHWDFRARSRSEIANRAHAEVERLALQERDMERRDLESAWALKERGFILPPGSQR